MHHYSSDGSGRDNYIMYFRIKLIISMKKYTSSMKYILKSTTVGKEIYLI